MALPVFDEEWFSLTGPAGTAEKIRRFNAAGTTIDELRGAGVRQSDIDWMLANDYSPPTQREPERVSRLAAEESAPSSASQQGIDVTLLAQELGLPSWMVNDLVSGGYSANDIRLMYPPQPSEPEPAAAPATVYVGGQALPPNWSSFSSRQKIDWYNRNNIKPSDLEAAGVSKADIDWMRSNGYQVADEPAPAPASADTQGSTRLSTATDYLTETEATTGREPEVDRRAPTTAAEDYLMTIDPSFQQKLFKPGSGDRYLGTFVKTFKSVDGRLIPAEATPDSRRSRDQAHPARHLELFHGLAQFLAIFALNTARHAPATRIIGHEHQIAAGKRNKGG